MRKRMKQAAAYALSAVLVLGLFTYALPKMTVKAEETNQVKTITLGSEILGKNVNSENAAIVYYDSYDDNGIIKSDPWYVIGYGNEGVASTEGSITLLAKSNMGLASCLSTQYYANSYIKDKVDKISGRLTNDEKKVVIARTLKVEDTWPDFSYCDGVAKTEVKNAFMWPLSSKEAVSVNESLLKASPERINQCLDEDNWWLRSPGRFDGWTFALVDYSGEVWDTGYPFLENDPRYYGIRPAFYLNTDEIILTSAAEGGKVSGPVGPDALTPVGEATNNEWKLTIHDSSRDTLKITRIGSGCVSAGSTIQFDYYSAQKGYLSAILVDSDNNILSYGNLVELNFAVVRDNSFVTIPSDLKDGDYTLKFISEECNADKMTDYASKFDPSREIKFTVKNSSGNGKVIQMGSEALASGYNTANAATLYFDNQSDAWRVIGYNGDGVASNPDTLTLLANTNIGNTVFGNFNIYSGSSLQTAIDNISGTTTAYEKKAISPRKLTVEEYNRDGPYCNGIRGTVVENAVMWPLSTEEALSLNATIRLANPTDTSDNYLNYWWLRSPGKQDDGACVDHDGHVYCVGYGNVTFSKYGVRPAFNLNLSSIILTSAAEGGKPTDVGAEKLSAINDYSQNEWKTTIYDDSRKDFKVNRKGVGEILPGGTCYFEYENALTKADTQKDEYISAILLDEKDELICYGKIVDLTDSSTASSKGEASVILPTNLNEGETYTLKFFSEQCNGDKLTDYASNPDVNAITFKTGKSIPAVDDFSISENLFSYDGTSKEITITPKYEGMGNITINYFDENNQKLESLPVNSGEYSFTIDVDNSGTDYKGANGISDEKWKLYITQVKPEAKDFKIDIPKGLTYDGKGKTVTASLADGLDGIGDIKLVYSDGNNKFESAPIDAGEYSFAIETQAGINFIEASDIKDEEKWKFKIIEAIPTNKDFVVTLPANKIYDGNAKEVGVTTKEGIGAVTVEYYGSDNSALSGAPTESGDYTFKLNVAASKNYSATTVTSEDYKFTIYPTGYNIRLVTNGGTINSGNVDVYQFEKGATLPTDITMAGYTFDGWFDNEKCEGTPITEISTTETGDKEFYAKWTPIIYSIDLNTDNNENGIVTVSDTSGIIGTEVTITATPNEGYKFAGWEVVSGGITLDDANASTTTFKIGTENVVLKAIFEEITDEPGTTDPTTQTGLTEPTDPTDPTEPEEPETETEPKLPEKDWLDDLRLALRIANELGGPRTVEYSGDFALSYDIMQYLADHPDITLIYTVTYEGEDYTITIPGGKAIADPNIPWYGPLWLLANYGGDKVPEVLAGSGKYTVVAGDTLSGIAAKFNTTVEELARKNGIEDPDYIIVGQVIVY